MGVATRYRVPPAPEELAWVTDLSALGGLPSPAGNAAKIARAPATSPPPRMLHLLAALDVPACERPRAKRAPGRPKPWQGRDWRGEPRIDLTKISEVASFSYTSPLVVAPVVAAGSGEMADDVFRSCMSSHAASRGSGSHATIPPADLGASRPREAFPTAPLFPRGLSLIAVPPLQCRSAPPPREEERP